MVIMMENKERPDYTMITAARISATPESFMHDSLKSRKKQKHASSVGENILLGESGEREETFQADQNGGPQ